MQQPKQQITPPPLAQKILRKLLRPDLLEEVAGDLDEKFEITLKKKSILRAKVNYWYQTLNYIRPFALKKRENEIQYTYRYA